MKKYYFVGLAYKEMQVFTDFEKALQFWVDLHTLNQGTVMFIESAGWDGAGLAQKCWSAAALWRMAYERLRE